MNKLATAAFLLLAGGLVVSVPGAALADDAVATIGGKTITRTELEKHVRPKLIEIENERYEALKEGLDELIATELITQEAKTRGTDPATMLKQEVDAKLTAPTDEEIQRIYDENKDELGGASLESVKPRIVEYLKEAKKQERRDAFIKELRTKHKTTVALRPPLVEVATAGRPERGGGAKAPVTIIMFSDYQCPFCKRGEDVVDKVLKTYGDKVRLVFRDFPLPMHPDARPAAEAAACANAQGKYWEYHAKLFENQSALGAPKLKEYAQQVGLDATKFDQCVKDRTFKDAIDKDLEDGARAGVSGTPGFFVNGRTLSGAQPFEAFKELIDEELAAAKRPS